MAHDDSIDLPLLWARASTGDTAAWDEIVRHMAPRLYGFFKCRGVPYNEALDLMQSTWTLFLARYDPMRSRVDSFLFLLARNLLGDRARRHRTWRSLIDDESGHIPLEDPHWSQESLKKLEQIERLRACLEQLEKLQQEVISLRFLDAELTTDLIADKLGLNVSTVKRISVKAFTNLKNCIELHDL